jgi:hypothetical protein
MPFLANPAQDATRTRTGRRSLIQFDSPRQSLGGHRSRVTDDRQEH